MFKYIVICLFFSSCLIETPVVQQDNGQYFSSYTLEKYAYRARKKACLDLGYTRRYCVKQINKGLPYFVPAYYTETQFYRFRLHNYKDVCWRYSNFTKRYCKRLYEYNY